MKIFLQGDFKSNTGPANANRSLRDSLKDYALICTSDQEKKSARIIEIIGKTLRADKVILCSYSKSNWITIFLAKILNRPIFYYMHGCAKIEQELNGRKPERIFGNKERRMLRHMDKIICISKLQKRKVERLYPECKNKILVHYNCFSLGEFKFGTGREGKKGSVVFSTGGGMPRKANLQVCEAIKYLVEEKNMDIRYIIAGNPFGNDKKLKNYSFVDYYDELSHEKTLKFMSECDLYIQNSKFETFGLAVIEALLQGASILIGRNIGSREILGDLEEGDLIFDSENVQEISIKIERLLLKGNANRIYGQMEKEAIDNKRTGKRLLEKL